MHYELKGTEKQVKALSSFAVITLEVCLEIERYGIRL